jgi:hypothetical protein
MVPSTLVKRLAMKKYVLGDEEGDDDDGNEAERVSAGASNKNNDVSSHKLLLPLLL